MARRSSPKGSAGTRRYPAAETVAGMAVPERVASETSVPATTESTTMAPTAPPLGAVMIRPSRRQVAKTQATTALQKLIEKTVRTLLLTASADGDLTFRADIKADVLSDVSVDVSMVKKGLRIVFYTVDTSSRRLLEGYQRELRAHLETRGFTVDRISVERVASDEAPPVPIG